MRSFRNDIAAALLGVVMASGTAWAWLFFHDMASRPALPDPAHGWVHALNNHGSYIYISNIEATGLNLLFYFGFVVGLAAILNVPKAGNAALVESSQRRGENRFGEAECPVEGDPFLAPR